MRLETERHVRRYDCPPTGTKRGFTLLEVLIALLVLSIGLVGLAVLTVQSLQNNHSALYTSLASAAALDFEERLWIDLGRRASGCPDPTNTFPNGNAFATDWGPSGTALGLPGLTFTANTDVTTTTTPRIRRIVFTLTWNEGRFGGTTETFTYESRVLCRG
jgi:type IV pilus assembly protein PilV